MAVTLLTQVLEVHTPEIAVFTLAMGGKEEIGGHRDPAGVGGRADSAKQDKYWIKNTSSRTDDTV